MNDKLDALMHDATRLTRNGDLKRATALLQQWIAGGGVPSRERASNTAGTASGEVLEGCVFEVDEPSLSTVEALDLESGVRGPEVSSPEVTREPTRENFLSGAHTAAGLTRPYKLYVPPDARPGLALVVMLHGCTQDPDDFAAGTAMNEHARARGFFVLYPAQTRKGNSSGCWNWFKHNHQQRGRGEPALIASLTRAVMVEYGIDPSRVFVAGLSAGGAMAGILGAAYPDLYAAIGVHSGLAPGVAGNVGEAMSAMNGTPPMAMSKATRDVRNIGVPTIVFHGDQDRTVVPANGLQVMAASLSGDGAPRGAEPGVQQGLRANGRSFTRTVYQDGQGRVYGEHWLVHGAAHAWSGGSPKGSHADCSGPDASAEMLRFFFEHSALRPRQG
ncbi:PHB depolymerase family esterase [Paucibacter sp. R3-3]|uniref:PHB depolymerase family esterase n=1 Tax=Roseateles agri TaxID=3098619 RepID=A0ABU5DQK5_9BURK|nr:PHB depolymerase family esterase [Paucibacter sp. R3-3]MDY0747554.1 PHB depolymerase family esterase [Paucibacter sp. R3-3]